MNTGHDDRMMEILRKEESDRERIGEIIRLLGRANDMLVTRQKEADDRVRRLKELINI